MKIAAVALLAAAGVAALVPSALGVSGSDKIVTIAGTGLIGHSGDDGPATEAKLSTPQALAVDSKGDLYVATCTDSSVRKVSGGVITTVAGTPDSSGLSGDGGRATAAQLNCPAGLAFDRQGALYISDRLNQRIRKVSGGTITTVATGFTEPRGLVVDTDGTIYVADQSAHVVRKVTDGTVTIAAGTGEAGLSGDGGPATAAKLNRPDDVSLDPKGNLYIADYANLRIRKVSGGKITTFAGGGTVLGDNGKATSAQLIGPIGIDVDRLGTLYVAEEIGKRIRRIRSGTITTVAGTGVGGFSGDGGPAAKAQISHPFDVVVDKRGNLDIADEFNERVRQVQNKQPSASFRVSTASGRAPLTVKFDASRSSDRDGQIAQYAWKLGDGAATDGAKLSHTYRRPGTYTVRLTVTDDSAGTSTASRTIRVRR